MIGIRRRDRLRIHERIIRSQRPAISEIAQSAVSCAKSTAYHQARHGTVCKTDAWSKVALLRVAQSEAGDAIDIDVAGGGHSVEDRRPRHLASFARDVIGSWSAV